MLDRIKLERTHAHEILRLLKQLSAQFGESPGA